MERLQQLTEGKKDDFMKPDTPQTTDYQSLHSLLMEMTGGQISDHEVATVARNYHRGGDETVSFENLISVAQEQQRKVNYEDFVKNINQCLDYSPAQLRPVANHYSALYLKIPSTTFFTNVQLFSGHFDLYSDLAFGLCLVREYKYLHL